MGLRLVASVSLLLAMPAGAQKPVPSLAQMLAALQRNVGEYIHGLPNLYCDEHVSSSFAAHGDDKPTTSMVEATFRIRRPPEVKSLADLEERRDIRLLDGEPMVDEIGLPRQANLPLLILGVFANAPALFSSQLQPCFDFALAETKEPGMVALEFSSKPARERPAACPNDHPSRGRAVLDAETLHLIRLEKTTPRFTIYPKTLGTWNWSVEYEPVDLAGQKFWLPKQIVSRSVADHGHATWVFDGTYTKYHRLFATAKVGPVTTVPAP